MNLAMLLKSSVQEHRCAVCSNGRGSALAMTPQELPVPELIQEQGASMASACWLVCREDAQLAKGSECPCSVGMIASTVPMWHLGMKEVLMPQASGRWHCE
jgi:hypothetical protein